MKALDKEGLDYLANKVYDAINSGGSADYIVEEGTSGIWTYRKWASGIAECWGQATYSGTWVQWGNLYALPFSPLSYPFTFYNIPVVMYNSDIQTSGANSCWAGGYAGATETEKKQGCKPALFRPLAGDTTAYTCHIYVRGLWKEFTPSTSRLNPLTEVLYSGAWTATRTSANGVALTDTLTIPNGYYIIIIKAPNLVTNAQYSLKASVNNTVPDNSIAVVPSHGLVTFMMKLTNTSNTVLGLSAQSAQQDFTLLERGGIYAMRIANS